MVNGMCLEQIAASSYLTVWSHADNNTTTEILLATLFPFLLQISSRGGGAKEGPGEYGLNTSRGSAWSKALKSCVETSSLAVEFERCAQERIFGRLRKLPGVTH